MPTQQATWLAASQLWFHVVRPLFLRIWLSGHTRLELGMANCVAHSVGIILSGLQYLFLSCRDDNEDINHDDGDL